MLSCDETKALIDDYVEKNLSGKEKEKVMQHLEDCDLCPQAADDFEQTVELCRQSLRQKTPAGFGDRLLDFLRDSTGQAVK